MDGLVRTLTRPLRWLDQHLAVDHRETFLARSTRIDCEGLTHDAIYDRVREALRGGLPMDPVLVRDPDAGDPMSRAVYAHARLVSLRDWEDARHGLTLWNGGDISSVNQDACGYVRHLTGRDPHDTIGVEAEALASLNKDAWWVEFDAAEAGA